MVQVVCHELVNGEAVKEFRRELLIQGSDEPDKTSLLICETVRDGFKSLESPFTLRH